ncbi:S8 family peptidase [Streptomyces somaliensis]|nr:S8 family peptidase [Streptomyces somaliensis]
MSVMRTSRRTVAAAAAVAAAVGLGTLSAHPAAAEPVQEGVIQYAGAPNAVQGSYIVTLKETADSDAASGKAVAARYGAKIKKTYTSALNGYAVTLSEEKARKLAADPAVKSVVQDRVFTITGTQPSPTWGLDRLDQRALPLNQSYTYPDPGGQGVTAYIIDTGVRVSHSDFGGRAFNGYDAVDNDNVAQDGNGHGTHVAGHRRRRQVRRRQERQDRRRPRPQQRGLRHHLRRRRRHRLGDPQRGQAAVANMSLGGGVDSTLDQAVRNSVAAGITYAVAAGNDNKDASTSSPARVPEAITVGSTTNTDARSSFSNYGSVLDIFAPGSNITSAWHTGDTATNTISGTSMAAPHVAGAAALYLANNPSATPSQVASAMTSSATSGVVTNPGTGSPNRLLYVGGGGGTTPPPPGSRFENTADYTIRDSATVESPVTVANVAGNAPSTLKVEVNIQHTYIGDLRVQLVAPDGSAYLLKDYSTGGSADNINTTYTVNASSEVANGTWKLRVTDNARYDTGKIDSWALQF